MDTKVRIAGVPEHFNLPWMMALEEGAFSARGIDLQWTDVPEGTGKMAQMLREDKADLAVILTEGLVKAVSDGLQAQIAQEFIASPLLWGIHVHQSSPFHSERELAGKTAAISRYGSGSHLMAYIHAEKQGWPLESLRFEVVNTLEGAKAALATGAADYFMWERFTTQPLVDQGVFRRVGVCPTPWPCFVIACSTKFGKHAPGVLSHLLEIINTFTGEFKDIPSIDRTLALRYGQKVEAIREWLSLTRWSQHQVKKQDLENTINTLNNLNLLSSKITAQALMWKP